jgi:hypothetical protein
MASLDPPDSVDEGTTTGAPTRVLTRVLSGVFVAARAAATGSGRLRVVLSTVLSAIGRCLGVTTAAVGGACRSAGRQLSMAGRRAATIGVNLWATCATPAVRILGAVASRCRRVAQRAATWIEHAAIWLEHAADVVLRGGGRAAATLGTLFARLATPVRHLLRRAVATLAPVLARMGQRVGRLVGAAWSTSHRLVTRAWTWFSGVSVVVVRGVRRAAARLGEPLGRLTAHARHLVRVAVAALEPVIARIAQALDLVVGATGRHLRRIAGRASRWLMRSSAVVLRAGRRAALGLGAVISRLAPPARHVVHLAATTLQHVAYLVASARDRVALSIGVAAARARTAAADVPTTIELGHRPAGGRDLTSGFTAEVFQNQYLPQGAREAHAIVTVTSTVGRDEGSPDSAVVLLLDCSGSMGRPWSKLRAVRRATAAAIDTLADGTWFAIVRGNDRARVAYPASGELVRSTTETRAAAKRAVRLLWPEGGTAMGRWLLAAGVLFAATPGSVNRAILLTDGRNESESDSSLADALRSCGGRFQCDCRGVGADWSVDELRTIANGLLGTIDLVPAPDLLATDFEALAAAAMTRGVGEVRLDVQAPSGGSVQQLSQTNPEWIQLPLERAADGVYRCSTGAWGAETRDFHLTMSLPAGEPGDEMLAAKVNLVVDGLIAARLQVTAVWCDDERQPTAMHPAVAHYETQAQLMASIARGLEAQDVGDVATATRELGRAAQLADATDHAATLRLLAAVVDVDDAPTGTVRIRPTVDPLEAMTLDARSNRTSAWRGDGDPDRVALDDAAGGAPPPT